MAITKNDILATYNQLYAADNGISKTFDQLSPREIVEALLVYMIDNTGGGGGGGLTVPQVTSAIQAATNIDNLETLLADIVLNTSTVDDILAKLPNLISGRLPVDVSALTVTVDNANLEISNDAGNPIPVTGTINTGLIQPLTDTQLRATPIPIALGLSNAVMLEVPALNLGAAGTIQTVSFTDIVSLEIKPRSNTEIWYTFDVDGFTNNTYKTINGVGQHFEFGQNGRKFTGNLYLQDPTNSNTLVEFAGFF
jgi:hypothetical protein